MRRLVLLTILAIPVCRTVSAQTRGTSDYARISIGVSGGYRTGALLWDVPNQYAPNPQSTPLVPLPGGVFSLHRNVSAGLTFAVHADFYSSPKWGVTGEMVFLGFKFNDTCTLAVDSGSSTALNNVCLGVHGDPRIRLTATTSALAFATQGGVVYRPSVRSGVQPYFKGMLGFATTPRNTAALTSSYGFQDGLVTDYLIYLDFDWATIRPVGTLVAGITSAPSRGIQLHVEARESFLPQVVVTGPNPLPGFVAQRKTVIKGFPSFLFGFDIVMKGGHGERY